MTMEEARTATSIMVLPSVWREAKKAAIDDDVDLSFWVEDAISKKLKSKKEVRQK